MLDIPQAVRDEYRTVTHAVLDDTARFVSAHSARSVAVVGFGVGAEIKLISAAAPHARVIAIDNDPLAVVNAVERFRDLQNVEVWQADVSTPAGAARIGDAQLIVCNFVLHLLGDVTTAAASWGAAGSLMLTADWESPHAVPVGAPWDTISLRRTPLQHRNPLNPATRGWVSRVWVRG